MTRLRMDKATEPARDLDLLGHTPYDVASLIVSGMEGGSGYWAQVIGYVEPLEPKAVIDAEVSEPPEVYPHCDYPLTGGAVMLRRVDEPNADPLRLDGDAIERGLRLLRDKPSHWEHWINQAHDATTGDVFIQLCLLGEIVYG